MCEMTKTARIGPRALLTALLLCAPAMIGAPAAPVRAADTALVPAEQDTGVVLDLTRQNRFNRLYSTGYKYYEIQEYASAIPALRACTGMDSTNIEVWYLLAMCYFQIDSLAGAREAYETILRQNPEDETALASLASIYFQQGEMLLVLEAYERLVEMQPENPEYREFLLSLYRQEGDNTGMLRMLQQQVEADPDNADAHRRMAEIFARQGDVEAQIRSLEESMRGDPDQIGTVERLARLYAGDPTRIREAADTYGRLTRLRPDDPVTWRLRGRFLGKVGEPDSAVVALVRALELAPDEMRVYSELAGIHLDQERYEEALFEVERAIAFDPEDGHAYITWGDILQAQGLAQAAEDGTVPYEAKVILEQAIEKYRMGIEKDQLAPEMRLYAEEQVTRLEPYRRTQAEIFMYRARDRTIPPAMPPGSEPRPEP